MFIGFTVLLTASFKASGWAEARLVCRPLADAQARLAKARDEGWAIFQTAWGRKELLWYELLSGAGTRQTVLPGHPL